MTYRQPLILVVDDDEAVRRSVEKILRFEKYRVTQAENGRQGIQLALAEEPDLILLDIKMPKQDGLEVLEEMMRLGVVAPVVMISGHGTVQTAVEATRLGAFDFLEKPLDRERLLLVCRNALEKKGLTDENRDLKNAMASKYHVVGSHPAFLKLLDRVDRVAPTNATVLITGESGTGKELIARRLHECSKRLGHFVQVNCAAIPHDLIESELFGHVKGAFTGAVEHQTGKFQLADKGTIFLDEIGDMSLNTQSKVLRVLQEGEVEKIGSGRMIQVDVRVVAATNKDLKKMVESGEFREDLFYRLNVVPIQTLSLSQRRSDIPDLVAHFTAQFERENHMTFGGFSEETMRFLMDRHYRGNIRELKNLVERMIILGEDELDPVKNGPSSAKGVDVARHQTLRQFKEAAERDFLIAKLKEFDGNISRTAEAIDTPRSNLYKKLEQYEIRVDQLNEATS